MTAAEPVLRAALFALDEVGDPTGARAILEQALIQALPLVSLHRPPAAKKVVTWAATQMAMSADDAGRAYSRLRELLAALFTPLAGNRAIGRAAIAAPAPEVAMTMTPATLVDALAPRPRVLARPIALDAKLDPRALLAEGSNERRVLGIRAIPKVSIGSFASELAAAIAGDAVLRAEAIEICAPAADKVRAKVAEALQPFAVAVDGAVRAAAIDGIHALRFQLDENALFAALHDPAHEVRAAAARTIGTGKRSYPAAIEQRILELIADPEAPVRLAALGALVRFPSLLGPAVVEPLHRAVSFGGDEARTAWFLLGRLGISNTVALAAQTAETETPESRLEGSPRVLEDHGAYAIAATDDALGPWDRGTGKRLFVVAAAAVLSFVSGRAEVAVIRIEPRGRKRAWHFERYRVPDGARLGSIAVPPQLAYGRPSQLVTAADLATIWCDDDNSPYRFHIKLGEPDAVIDDAPVPGRPSKKA